jgi:hypothetical protein
VSTAAPIEHIDLENLVVALLAEDGTAYPNALYALGYRLHHFDAGITLLDPTSDPPGRPVQSRLDSVAHRAATNTILAIECKSGADAGLSQVPEGKPVPAEQWAEALALPRGTSRPPQTRGLLVAATESLDPKLPEIEALGTSWLRADSGAFDVAPDNLGDPRVAPALRGIPKSPWPRSYVPFSHDPTDGRERVVAAIAPLILSAASRGEAFVSADDLVRQTHAAVWRVTDSKRQSSWTGVVGTVLEQMAAGALQRVARYDKPPRRLLLNGVRPGIPASMTTLVALRRALAAEHRKSLAKSRRIKVTKPDQLALWPEDSD